MEEGRANGQGPDQTGDGNVASESPPGRTWGQFFADHAKPGDNFDKTMKPVTVPLQTLGIATGIGYVGYKLVTGQNV